jgi:hypothetical protein
VNYCCRAKSVCIIYICVCVCVCVCMRARNRTCACVWVPRRVGVCTRVTACSLAYPICSAYASHFVICGLSGSTIFFDGTVLEKRLLNLKCVF